jgi:Reverse transcriptase (RNA-dependent DNA polymerase)
MAVSEIDVDPFNCPWIGMVVYVNAFAKAGLE